ncbi:type I-F CRISPR-associated protein Csy1 [Vibrio cortegadensis]|uniref:Type I-F CRISPR-associated protein Csy1 n=1 Tax=Vibrio cortegadensis TaxID=1328770 RepID=A0ABV4MBE7_9VIBR
MAESLTKAIHHFIEDRYQTKREALDKDHEKERSQATTAQDIESVEAKFAKKREKLLFEHDVSNWLDNASKLASKISMATHIAKFTHSSSKGSSFLAEVFDSDPRYLDTNSISEPAIDIAVSDAKAAYVGSFMRLEDQQGISLYEYFKNEDYSSLTAFTTNQPQLESWITGLSEALKDTQPSSHTFGKQVYFPVNDGFYHLLIPLYSSSISQGIYDEIQYCRFSKGMKEVRGAKKIHLWHESYLVSYPNIAMTSIGGSNAQNVSKLNSGRRGINYLFSTRPPEWQSQLKAPLTSDNIFTHPELRYATRFAIKRLVSFLIQVNQQERESNLAIRNKIKRLVDEVIDEVFAKVSQWQQLPLGWSDEANELPAAQCRWLDPNNSKRDQHDDQWLQDIAKAFGGWLVDNVNHFAKDELSLGLVESNQWQEAFKQALREIS